MGYKKIYYEDISKANASANSVCRSWNDQLDIIASNLRMLSENGSFTGKGAQNIKAYLKDTYPLLISALKKMIEAYYRQFQLYEVGFPKEVDSGSGQTIYTTLVSDEIKTWGTVYNRLTSLLGETLNIQTSAIKAVKPIAGMVSGGLPMPKGNDLVQAIGETRKIATDQDKKAELYEKKHSKDLDAVNNQIKTIRSTITRLSGQKRSFITQYQSGQIRIICDINALQVGISACEKAIKNFYHSEDAVDAEYRTLFYKSSDDGIFETTDDGISEAINNVLWRGESISNIISKIAEIREKSDVEEGAGYAADGIGYWISLKKFYESENPKDIAYNFIEFAKSSGKVYTNVIYETITKWLKKNVGEATAQLFENRYYNNIKGVGLATSVLDFGVSVSKIFISDEKMTIMDGVAATLDAGSSGMDVLKDVYLLTDKGRTAKEVAVELAKGNKGFLKKLLPDSITKGEAYFRIGSAYLDFGAQAVRSVKEYSEDGEFDGIDFGMTGIDSSVKGLWTLSGLDTIEDLIKLFTGNNDTDAAKYISSNIKEFGKDYGKYAGNIVVNDPNLKKIYDKGGFGEVVAITAAMIRTPSEKIAESLTSVAETYGVSAGEIILNNPRLLNMYNRGGIGETAAISAGIIAVPFEKVKSDLSDIYYDLFGDAGGFR